ncbi:MAG: ATP-dependent helicase HrpA, partial [Solirubrobacteraceae bacterium]|nr:ATP-dependent helicase HrpA [Solirubrobacteraceae bacterium]
VARIDPRWVEPLAEHLVSRSYSEPRWQRSRAQVVATERVTLLGLPIVPARTVGYGAIDPPLARELFIRRALVEADWNTRHAFMAENARAIEEVGALEDRARRRDLLVSDQVLFEFFDARIPADVVSGAHFDRWWRDARRDAPDALTYTRELLIAPGAADALAGSGRPGEWKQGDLRLRLSYRFEPGTEQDGVTVHVPLKVLPQLRGDGFDWLVPALRPELVTALIRSLPKELRRALVPVPQVVDEVLERLRPRQGRITDAVARAIEETRGVRIPPDAWDASRLPEHLRMGFRVEDEAGEAIAEGTDLDALRRTVGPRLRAELAAASASLERHGLRDWPGGELPQVVALPGTGQAVRAYPALADEGEAVGVAVLETPAAQRASMYAGTRRLLRLTIPSPQRFVSDRLDNAAKLALASAPHGSIAAVLDDAQTAALDALVAEAGGLPWNEAAWRRLRDHVAGSLADRTAGIAGDMIAVLDAARAVERALEPLTAPPLQAARADVRQQLRRLVRPGFASASGAARLPDVTRYLRAAVVRLERLPDVVATDRDRMDAVHELERAYRERLESWPRGRPLPASLRELPWMLEELRVSHFAQGLGIKGGASSKRIRRALAEA